MNDVIVILPDENEKPDTFLHLPEKNSEEKISPYGTIISYGPEVKNEAIKPGVRILYQRFRDKPSWVWEDDIRYRFITEDYILAVIHD